MNTIVLFILLQIANVILSTIRSITTIKSGKTVASLVSAIYYAYYTVVVIWTVADFPLWQKCVITFATNLLGVFIVKLFEEKARKDKLWKIEVSIKANVDEFAKALESVGLSFNNFGINNGYEVFNIYCKTQADSTLAKNIITKFKAKYFVAESKIL